MKRVPKGTSDYQAAWILDEQEEENDENKEVSIFIISVRIYSKRGLNVAFVLSQLFKENSNIGAFTSLLI